MGHAPGAVRDLLIKLGGWARKSASAEADAEKRPPFCTLTACAGPLEPMEVGLLFQKSGRQPT